MAIEKDVLDQLLAGRDPKEVFSKDGLVDELKKALSERILNAELDEHLDSEGDQGKGNHRNGYSKTSVLTGTSKMTLSVPRDRAGTFDPKLIAKYQRRFPDGACSRADATIKTLAATIKATLGGSVNRPTSSSRRSLGSTTSKVGPGRDYIDMR